MQTFVEQREAVEDVDGQPADGEQSHDDGEGLGGPDLLLQQAVVMAVPVTDTFELDLSQLLPGHGEDLQVDTKHDEQRWQHTNKEVKVDHVLHLHHALKEALGLAIPRGATTGSVVPTGAAAPTVHFPIPAKEGDKADDEGEDP